MKFKSVLLGMALVAAITATAFSASASTSPAIPEPGNVSTGANNEYGDTSITVYEQVKKDGTTVYSVDGGLSWLSQKDYEKLYPTHSIEWWTYDEYAQYVEQKKMILQKMADDKLTGYTSSRGEFTWTQELVDEAIQRYEQDLENIKNGTKISKSISGLKSEVEGGAAAYESYSLDPKESAVHTVEIILSNETIKQFSGENKADVYDQIKNFCTDQVARGEMTQEQADAILDGAK